MEVGPVSSTGMGVSAVSWAEIAAWRNLAGHNLSAWASETIRAASRAYAVQVSECENKSAPAPWRLATEDPAEVMNRIKAGMDALMANRGRRK